MTKYNQTFNYHGGKQFNTRVKRLNYKIPQEGEIVFVQGKTPMKLKRLIKKGGEGTVYETDHAGKVCKIYHPEKLNTSRIAKLKHMLSNPIKHVNVVWPEALVTNDNNEPVGYSMERIDGYPIRSLYIPPQAFADKFNGWDRKHLVSLIETILKTIVFLHQQNIVIGDINEGNIFFTNPHNVYLIDTDSFQIENHPCYTNVPHYTAPELLRRKNMNILRTFGHDSYAIAVLVFRILFLGKAPYAKRNQNLNDTIEDRIMNMDFPYDLGTNITHKQAAVGYWPYVWSHLPFRMKEVFVETFQKGGSFSLEKNRLTSKQWLNEIQKYKFLLDKGIMEEQDKMSIEIHPTRNKNKDKSPYEKDTKKETDKKNRQASKKATQSSVRNKKPSNTANKPQKKKKKKNKNNIRSLKSLKKELVKVSHEMMDEIEEYQAMKLDEAEDGFGKIKIFFTGGLGKAMERWEMEYLVTSEAERKLIRIKEIAELMDKHYNVDYMDVLNEKQSQL